METINNQIIKLALNYCDDHEADSPEEMLYGLVKLSSLSDMALEYLLKEKGIEDTEEIRSGIEEIRVTLKERNLDSKLIKDGLAQLIPIVEKTNKDSDQYRSVVNSYEEKQSVQAMVQDVLSAIDPEELKAFSVGKELKDVGKYIQNLREKPDENDSYTEQETSTRELTKTLPKENSETSTKKEEDKPYSPVTEEVEILSEELKGYLETLKSIIPVIIQSENQELLWRQSLVVSIDDGFGFSTFVRHIETIFKENDLIGGKSFNKSIVDEVRVVYDPKEQEHYFDDILPIIEKKILEKSDITDRKRLYSILAVDLSLICGRLDDPRFKDFLRCIEQNCDSVLVVFRLPYLEHNVINDINMIITDILAVETITVAPLSIPCMVEYMHKRAQKYGYKFGNDCDEYLEKGIITEKNDGRFYGFRTLNKIVDTVIYKFVIEAAKKKKTSNRITAKQLKGYIDISEQIDDYEIILERMIGVDEIMAQIESAINQVKESQRMFENGNEVERPTIHMMFRGGPGTGKTTIARIVAARMKAAGILKKGNFFEIKGRDLCGQYVGTTTPRTNKICRDAYGSVLFIDEAYELYRGEESSGNDYGREALTALVAEMESHKDDMCVIFAGYTDEMNTMVTGNLGLKDRIPIIIDFPNYSREQLEEIFFKMMEGKFEYENGVKEKAHEFFSSLEDDLLSGKGFSNARFVRNLFESVWRQAANRSDNTGRDKLVIKESDFTTAVEKIDLKSMVEKKMGRIGFVV